MGVPCPGGYPVWGYPAGGGGYPVRGYPVQGGTLLGGGTLPGWVPCWGYPARGYPGGVVPCHPAGGVPCPGGYPAGGVPCLVGYPVRGVYPAGGRGVPCQGVPCWGVPCKGWYPGGVVPCHPARGGSYLCGVQAATELFCCELALYSLMPHGIMGNVAKHHGSKKKKKNYGMGTPPLVDRQIDGWMDGWMDRHVSKHYLPVVLRTRAVKITLTTTMHCSCKAFLIFCTNLNLLQVFCTSSWAQWTRPYNHTSQFLQMYN